MRSKPPPVRVLKPRPYRPGKSHKAKWLTEIYVILQYILDAVAITFISKIFGPASFMAQFVAPALVAISCIGGLNGIIFTASRMPFAGARLVSFLLKMTIKLLTNIVLYWYLQNCSEMVNFLNCLQWSVYGITRRHRHCCFWVSLLSRCFYSLTVSTR